MQPRAILFALADSSLSKNKIHNSYRIVRIYWNTYCDRVIVDSVMLAQVQRSPEVVGVWKKQRGEWLGLFADDAFIEDPVGCPIHSGPRLPDGKI